MLLALRAQRSLAANGFGGLKHRQGGASKASVVHEDLAVGVWASKPLRNGFKLTFDPCRLSAFCQQLILAIFLASCFSGFAAFLPGFPASFINRLNVDFG